MDSSKEQLIKLITKRKEFAEKKKFGEFILQTNEVQFYLSLVILLQSSHRDKNYWESIERAELGSLINFFCACAKNNGDIAALIGRLREYNKQRNRLAHKMFTPKRLTEKECEQAIIEGKEILKDIKKSLTDAGVL